MTELFVNKQFVGIWHIWSIFKSALNMHNVSNIYESGKVKPIWILLKRETLRWLSGSGISWAICKFALRFRQITTPAPHNSVFIGRMPFLSPSQQHQSTEGLLVVKWWVIKILLHLSSRYYISAAGTAGAFRGVHKCWSKPGHLSVANRVALCEFINTASVSPT